MPDINDASPYCEACRHVACACAQTVADIDAWADAYLGSAAHGTDYVEAQRIAQQTLKRADWCADEATLGLPRAPVDLEDMEPDE